MATAVAVKKPNLIKPKSKPRRQANRLTYLFRQAVLVLFFFSVCLFIKVYWQTTVNENNIKINSLKLTLEQQKKANEELFLQANLLKSPERIFFLATRKLEMSKPDAVTYLIMPVIKVKHEKLERQALAGKPTTKAYTVK